MRRIRSERTLEHGAATEFAPVFLPVRRDGSNALMYPSLILSSCSAIGERRRVQKTPRQCRHSAVSPLGYRFYTELMHYAPESKRQQWWLLLYTVRCADVAARST